MSARCRCPTRGSTRLATIAKSARGRCPTRLTFVDIAGLVRGASKGEGLGNQFLAHIREVDAVAYVLRCFEDADVIHVEGRVDPIADAETIETELMLADLDSLERRLPILEKKMRGQDKEAKKTLELVERVARLCCAKASLRGSREVADDERTAFKALNLLTSKPVLYVCNVDEASAATGNAHSRSRRGARARGRRRLRRHLGQDRGRACRASSEPSGKPISPSLDWPSPA